MRPNLSLEFKTGGGIESQVLSLPSYNFIWKQSIVQEVVFPYIVWWRDVVELFSHIPSWLAVPNFCHCEMRGPPGLGWQN